MKDLKHIHHFTDLLEQTNNELVQKAVNEGKQPFGYTCHFVPEPLLNLKGGFSVKLRAPNTGSLDISTYYLSNFICGYAKAMLERAIEGGYNFLGALFASETCAEMNRACEHFELLDLVPNEKFLISFIDSPIKLSQNSLNHYVKQLSGKILEPQNKVYGIDISSNAIREAINQHNEVCEIVNAIGEFRREDQPRITGTEFHIINLITYTCPKEYIVDMLKETLEEIKSREPDPINKYRARIVVAGSELDDYHFTELIEECGAYVAADRYCFGAHPGRQSIPLNEDEDPLVAIARHYMQSSQCPRYMGREKVDSRGEYVRNLVRDYKADGVVYQMLKFCEYWGYERALASHVITEEFGIPSISLDRQYTVAGSGQLRTRIQALVESLEIKKLQHERRQSV